MDSNSEQAQSTEPTQQIEEAQEQQEVTDVKEQEEEADQIVEQIEEQIDSHDKQQQLVKQKEEEVKEDGEEQAIEADHLINIRVAMLGNVDAGKSTLSGILTSAPGTKDDGRGAIRSKVFNFSHEQKNGRTSSIAHEIMGFDANGEQYVTKIGHTSKKNRIWPDIVENSAKIIHLLDMCGHEKYLKTTMHGLTSLFPDYCLLVVGANMGISKMTKEHLGISLALNLPVIVVFTKIDLAPENVYSDNIKKIQKIMKINCSKTPWPVKTMEDIDKIKGNIKSGKICPIFSVSNLDATGIDLLRYFLSILPKSTAQELNVKSMEDGIDQIQETEVTTKFIVDSRFFCRGVGLILGGTVLRGEIKLDQQMMFGPDRNGNFRPVVIKGIHENRVPIMEAGEMASICVHVKTIGKNSEPIKNNQIRKGSCLINPIVTKLKGTNPYQALCVKYFEAFIKVLHHHTHIKDGYQAVLHIGGVRQTVQAVKIHDNDCMRTNDQGKITFKFKYGVEFIEKGDKIMIREGNTKAFGHISEIYPMHNPPKDLVDKFTINDVKI